MDNIKINFIDEADTDKEMLNDIYALSELAALDDDNLQSVNIDGIRYSGVYIKNDKLTCSQCHNPLPKLKEQLHIHMDDTQINLFIVVIVGNILSKHIQLTKMFYNIYCLLMVAYF